ncbi:MAG: fatty acyl-AMP ligase [Methylocystis sp.]|uniref:fatty acyl-AMP ligase n=1 Tax=Methylocystis sp. TaxID=1911079 RepID=UPI0039360C63
MTPSSATRNSATARILRHASRAPDREAIIFLDRGETVSTRLTYESLVSQVGGMARRLAAEGFSGKAIVIALPAGIAFVRLFLACLWARVIVIPAPYPSNARLLNRLHALVADSRPVALVTDANGVAKIPSLPQTGAPLRILDISSLADENLSPLEPLAGAGDAPAIIQYTSGSTSEPRGAVITHDNLFANQCMIQSAFGHDERCVGANWLPHFHDMGLLGVILQPLFVGGSTVLMDPLAFIQKPIRWLRAIDRFHATTAGGPCFAYDLCARHCAPEDIEKLDLSSWRVAFCGAEPIRRATLDAFAATCASASFDPRALTPCYGLAEATLIVSSANPGNGARELPASGLGSKGTTTLAVGCGYPAPECKILVRAADGAPLPDGEAGEIWVAGPHVSPGVWNGEEGGVNPFNDSFVDEAGDRYIATGDLGALVNGELVPLDRLKDIIIVYGQKLHSADIEATLLSHRLSAELLAACAFSIETAKGDQLVVVCEMDRKRFREGAALELAAQLKKIIAESFGVLPQLAIVPYGALPRTTSGKIQRSVSKSEWLAGRIAEASRLTNA